MKGEHVNGLKMVGQMATDAQFKANRQNANKSTGPNTQLGKSVASQNAVKHGLTASRVTIPGEDPNEFDELRLDLEEELKPAGRQECDLIETIAMCIWRRRRIYQMEAGILACEQAEKQRRSAERELDLRRSELDQHYERIEMASSEVGDLEEEDGEDWKDGLDKNLLPALEEAENNYQQAEERFNDTEKEFESLSTNMGTFFLGNRKYSDALEKLLRYDAANDRSQTRAQDQLARLQRDREERAAARATVIDASHLTEETPE